MRGHNSSSYRQSPIFLGASRAHKRLGNLIKEAKEGTYIC